MSRRDWEHYIIPVSEYEYVSMCVRVSMFESATHPRAQPVLWNRDTQWSWDSRATLGAMPMVSMGLFKRAASEGYL